MRDNPTIWAGLREMTVGAPTLSSDQLKRYRFIATTVNGRHVLHVIDRTTTAADYVPTELTISLDATRFGNPRSATRVVGGVALDMERDGPLLRLTLCPDPVASVIFGEDRPR